MGNTEAFTCRSDGFGSLICTCNESTEDKLIETSLMGLLKKEVDYPVGLGSFRIEQCPNVLDIKLDFDQLKMVRIKDDHSTKNNCILVQKSFLFKSLY